MCIYVIIWHCYFFWHRLIQSAVWGLPSEREAIDERSTNSADTIAFVFIKVLFPWAQEESDSRRQWVCWYCRTECSVEIPSLNGLPCAPANCAAAATHSSGLDQHTHPTLHLNSLTLPKNFFSLVPGSLTVLLKVKETMMGSDWSRVQWWWSQPACGAAWRGSARWQRQGPAAQALRRGSTPRTEVQAAPRKYKSFLSQSDSSLNRVPLDLSTSNAAPHLTAIISLTHPEWFMWDFRSYRKVRLDVGTM